MPNLTFYKTATLTTYTSSTDRAKRSAVRETIVEWPVGALSLSMSVQKTDEKNPAPTGDRAKKE